MSFNHPAFSRAMKMALSDYLDGGMDKVAVDPMWLKQLSAFNPKSLTADDEKKAFWINLYNGLTNLQIVTHQLKESVWELLDFFTGRRFMVGDFSMSLDDIEHGILRKNGPRRNGKPRQFEEENPRQELMVDQFDPHIHFALNCGSVSCPPIVFYTAENIELELAQAEENFVSQEFLVDHENKTITCSAIFVWYRVDFTSQYLGEELYSGYKVIEKDYVWRIKWSKF